MHVSMKWFHVIEKFAPMVIESVHPELGPIAGEIISAIQAAEKIKDAAGPDKLAYVVDTADKAIAVANKAGAHIDTATAHGAIINVTQAIVGVANTVKSASDLRPTQSPTS